MTLVYGKNRDKNTNKPKREENRQNPMLVELMWKEAGLEEAAVFKQLVDLVSLCSSGTLTDLSAACSALAGVRDGLPGTTHAMLSFRRDKACV